MKEKNKKNNRKKIISICILLIAIVLVLIYFCLPSYKDVICFDGPSPRTIYVKNVFMFLQFILPLIVIVIGFVKLDSKRNSKDKREKKEASKNFIKSIIIALLIFVLITFVKLVIGIVESNNTNNEREQLINC